MALTTIADVADVQAGKAKAVQIGNKRIAVFHIDGAYYAVDDACTHRGGSLAEGGVDGTTVTCPWHGATFDIKTGCNLSPPAPKPVGCYPVVIEGSTLKIDLP
jgi:nitrite reductase/ring-hydroxylating ferredoxin subunit